jgi:hypothetical protein
VAKCDQNGVQEPDGGTPDWIELHNNSNADIVLNEKIYLSDDKDFLKKWHFEQVEIIPANGYLILWADKDVHQMGIHTNFKIDAEEGDLFMTYEDMTNIQEIQYTEQELNKGYARVPNGTGAFIIQNHTFNANNENPLSSVTTSGESDIISIYPNPTNGIVYLSGNIEYKIYNVLGTFLMQGKGSLIDLSAYSNGIYLLESEHSRTKIIKE